jgi:hypothetical protein
MKKLFTLLSFAFVICVKAQVGINTTNPTATLHVVGTTTLPSGGGSVDLLNQNFNSAYSVIHSNNGMVGCASPATNGWERTTVGSANANCTSCTGGWLFIYSDETGCGQNATARIDFTTAPTSTNVTVSFAYRYNNFGATGDSFRVYLYNNTTNSQVGANLVGVLTTDANTTYSGASTVVAGNSYSLRFEYIGDYDYGASIDNVLVTETSAPTGGSYSFRLEDGTQASGKVMTSDASGNAYWATPTGGSSTDSQILSVSGSNLTISNGNTIALPSGSSNTYTNGLTLTGSTVRLGGTLTQGTTINLNDDDLTFSSSTTSAFPGEMIIQGSDRDMMRTNFDNNYVAFGTSSYLGTSVDGTSVTDSGGNAYTIDVALGIYNGNSGGSGLKMGSIEYLTDGLGELFVTHDFSPLTDNSNSSGTSTHRWDRVYATNGTIQTSDLRLKKNVKKLNYGLNEIMKLETITYNWKENKKGKTLIPENLQERKIGFSAQQLKEILPETVNTHSWVAADEEGNYKRIENENLGVFYSDIIPVTVKAIQEQQAQIEELKKEIEELKALIRSKK